MKQSNKKYWDNFYKKKLINYKPSNFALFVNKFLNKKYTKVVDVGCGNGKDLFYFKKKKIEFYGIELSKNATSLIKKQLDKRVEKDKIFNESFINFDYEKNINGIFSIYSRFTWHTINNKNEKIFLNKISNISNLKYLFIETRSNKDDLYGYGKKVGKNEFVTDHYRRFIDSKELLNKLRKHFKILYFKESKGFSKFKNEDPCLIRVIAEKVASF